MGARAYTILERYIERLTNGVAVEIGTERQEGSTTFLASLCEAHGLQFFSVDVDPGEHELARRRLGERAVCAKGEDFLPTLDTNVCFAYLDNFDWMWEPHAEAEYENYIARYKTFGLEMNNLNSQRSHLAQAVAVCGKRAAHCLIIIDDTWRRADGTFDGKGGAAVPYLLNTGFELLQESPLHEPPGAVALWSCPT